MLRVVLRTFEALLLALVGYNLATALFGWRNPAPAPAGERRRRMRVVVPAHDEERVVGALLADLAVQDYAGPRETWVLADRCTDGTAAVAEAAGVGVAERSSGPDGKGATLSWYLAEHPLREDEALVVLDADNRVPPGLLSRLADELDAGHRALQCYLDVANPDASGLATASALSYWASNRMVQLARRNLGWSADLGGTGMCLTAGGIAAAGGFGTTLVEDQDLGVRLHLAGIPVVWIHDVRVRDEKPVSAGVAVRQRSRWASGRRAVARSSFGRLLRMGGPASLDLAIRLVQPSRMGVAVGSASLAVGSALGLPLLPWGMWAAVAGVQVLAPIPFLAREGVPRRYLLRYPLLTVLPLLKLPARLLRQRGWYHTPHG
jgi:cellulose synthase/poly-beta-1,6-N-acetylglucosamine synthase-like glycosyltransferase